MSQRKIELVIPVDCGHLAPTAGQQAIINTFLAQRNGKAVAVKFSIPTNTRSQRQNRFYWSCVIATIADHCGYAPEEVHEVLKDKFLPRKFITLGKHEIELKKSTTDLNTIEFETFIEQVLAWASTELGLFIPTPNETGSTL